MNYIYEITGYKKDQKGVEQQVHSEKCKIFEEAKETVLILQLKAKRDGRVDMIYLDEITDGTFLCKTRWVYRFMACGKWDEPTRVTLNEDKL